MSQNNYLKRRMVLHRALEKIPGVRKIYFQPPSSEQIKYPCIIYQFNRYSQMEADNIPYLTLNEYTVTVIDHDPESCIPQYILDENEVYKSSFDRFYVADNLNHWVFNVIITHHECMKEGNYV